MANGTTSPAAQPSAAAAAKAKALKAAQKALRYSHNQDVAKYFAVGMAGLMAVFIFTHWTRFFYDKIRGAKRSDSKVGPLIAFTRLVYSHQCRESKLGVSPACHPQNILALHIKYLLLEQNCEEASYP